jgi:lipopolysaccharide transport system ATP-binding protein
MADTVIQVENLGKKYILGHQQEGHSRYVALRDVVSEGAKSVVRRLRHPGKRRPNPNQEEFWALKDVSFEVKQGEVVGIIGRNGAGKSTLLKILSRITEPTEGRIKLRGRVASLLEVGTGFHPELTGRENIFLNGAILGMSRAEINRKFDEIVEFAEVSRFLDTPVKRYSSGMYVRLAFAVAAHLEPEILVVDEVLAVGDIAFQKKCLRKMGDISKQEGRTILFVSHQMESIQNLCQEGLLLGKGRLISQDNILQVIQRYLDSAKEVANKSLKDREDRRGSGKIRFTEVYFCNSSGQAVSAFLSGSESIICLRYEKNTSESLQNFHLSIGIDDFMGNRIAFLSTEISSENFPTIDEDKKEAQVIITKMPLMPGKYGFTVFSTINGEISDWIHHAGSFDVVAGDFYGTGRLLPSGQGNFLIDHHFRMA